MSNAGAMAKLTKSTPPHPADGMAMPVEVGNGAAMTIVDPRAYLSGGIEWTLRYGNPIAIRYSAASLVASYDYLLSGEITLYEATRRLRLMRSARRTALQDGQAE